MRLVTSTIVAWATDTVAPPIESGGWIDNVFRACVDVLLALATKLRVSYNAINVWIFCILWPLLTLALIGTVVSQRRRIQRLRRSLRVVVSTKL